MNILLINAHQFYEGFAEGKLSQTMIDIAKTEFETKGNQVQITKIEDGYDINQEVKKHIWADVIITQSPVYWFGNPWIYKKYVDEILTTGLVQQNLIIDDGRTREDPAKQYGTGGKMQGKKYMLSLTWNAPEEAFNDKNQFMFEGKSIDDAFASNRLAYKFCGAELVTSFSCFNVVKEPKIEQDIARYKEHLANYLLS